MKLVSIGRIWCYSSLMWTRYRFSQLSAEYGFSQSRNQNNSFNPDLFSDTHTFRIHCEYSRTECVGGAKEVTIERFILIIRGDPLERKIRIGNENSSSTWSWFHPNIVRAIPKIKCNSPMFCELRMKLCTLMWHPILVKNLIHDDQCHSDFWFRRLFS